MRAKRGGAAPMVRFSLFNSDSGILTKRLFRDAAGALQKQKAATLYRGHVETIETSWPDGFAEILPRLKLNQALGYGVHDGPGRKEIVTQDVLASHPGAIARNRDHFHWDAGPGILMLDYDPPSGRQPLSRDALVKSLRDAVPELENVQMLWRPSASSCIYDKKTEQLLAGISGQRLYVLVARSKDIPAIGTAIYHRLWLAGYGYIKVSKSGRLLDRTIADQHVWQPERLDFAAGADTSGDLVQRLPHPELVAGSRLLLRKRDFAVTKVETARFDELVVNAEREKELDPEVAKSRQAYLQERASEFAKKTGLDIAKALEVIQSALATDVLHGDFVLYSQQYGAVTVSAVLAAPKRFHNTHFRDPLEPDYEDDERIAWANLEAQRPFIYSHAHGGKQYWLSADSSNASTPSSWDEFFDQMNREFAVIPVGSSVRIMHELGEDPDGVLNLVFRKKEDFKLFMANRRAPQNKSAHAAWLSDHRRRQYKGITFSPGRETPGYFNLFRGWPVSPVEGDTSLFWAFVRNVICAGIEPLYLYVRQWLAHLIQHPEELPEVALVLHGGQGIGKNTFVRYIAELVKPYFRALVRAEQLTGRFNGHLKGALLVHANEATWGGNKSDAGALKSLITDPMIPIEHKGIDIAQVKNCARIIVSSNEDWVVATDLDDRRFLYLEVAETHKRDHKYFERLERAMVEDGGVQGLMFDLLNEDIAEFNPRDKPASPFGFEQKLRSSDSVTRFVYERLQAGVPTEHFGMSTGESWPESIGKDKWHQNYLDWCKGRHERMEGRSSFHKKVRSLLRGQIGDLRPGSGESRERHYSLGSLQQCRAAFEQAAGAKGAIAWEEATPSKKSTSSTTQRSRHERAPSSSAPHVNNH